MLTTHTDRRGTSPFACRPALAVCLAAACLAVPAQAGSPNDAIVTFGSGTEGWSLNGSTTISATGGNPGHRLRWPNPVDTFGLAARTDSHAAFIGDYTQKGPVTLSIDYQVTFIRFFGTPVNRELVVILYDDDTFNGAAPAAVWKPLGTLTGAGMAWTTFATEVLDADSDTLPEGWQGAGDEDPETFEPVLPAGRTWSNVLQGVDRIEFTTYVPGFFYGFTNFDVSVDNIAITPVEPPPCVGDLNGDGVVGGADLGALLTDWGLAWTPADLNGDLVVNGADLGLMLSVWGDCP